MCIQSQCLCNYLFIYIWLFMQLRVYWISSSDWLTQAYMCNLQKVFVKDSRMLPSQPLSVPCQQYVKLWWSSFTKKKKIVLDLLLVFNFLSILFLEVILVGKWAIETPLALEWNESDILACRKWQQPEIFMFYQWSSAIL